MTEQVVLIAIAAVVAAVVFRPLLRSRRRARGSSKSVEVLPAISDEMAELELDREMGRVSAQDYARWRAELERATPTPVADSGALSAPNAAESSAEGLVRQWRQAPRPTCKTCGMRPEPDARFCSNCGAELSG